MVAAAIRSDVDRENYISHWIALIPLYEMDRSSHSLFICRHDDARRRSLAFHEFPWDLVAGVAKEFLTLSENDRNDQQLKPVNQLGIQQLRIERGASPEHRIFLILPLSNALLRFLRAGLA